MFEGFFLIGPKLTENDRNQPLETPKRHKDELQTNIEVSETVLSNHEIVIFVLKLSARVLAIRLFNYPLGDTLL